MSLVLVNLSNSLYENSRMQLNESARKVGIGDIRSYDFGDLKSSAFYSNNRPLLDQPTGMGFWLWKPYIIQQALNTAAAGDLIIYCDSGLSITGSLDPLLACCTDEQPVLLFGNGNLRNSMWTKRDCFVLMDCDEERYWQASQCDAAFAVFRKTAMADRFVEEWLRYAVDPRIISDQPNTCGRPNLRDFVVHRHDQSILSLLAEKYRLSLYRMPTQNGNHYKMHAYRVDGEYNKPNQMSPASVSWYAAIPYYNSPYPQLLDHHRGNIPRKPSGSAAQRMIAKVKRKWTRIIWSVRNGRPYSAIGK